MTTILLTWTTSLFVSQLPGNVTWVSPPAAACTTNTTASAIIGDPTYFYTYDLAGDTSAWSIPPGYIATATPGVVHIVSASTGTPNAAAFNSVTCNDIEVPGFANTVITHAAYTTVEHPVLFTGLPTRIVLSVKRVGAISVWVRIRCVQFFMLVTPNTTTGASTSPGTSSTGTTNQGTTAQATTAPVTTAEPTTAEPTTAEVTSGIPVGTTGTTATSNTGTSLTLSTGQGSTSVSTSTSTSVSMSTTTSNATTLITTVSSTASPVIETPTSETSDDSEAKVVISDARIIAIVLVSLFAVFPCVLYAAFAIRARPLARDYAHAITRTTVDKTRARVFFWPARGFLLQATVLSFFDETLSPVRGFTQDRSEVGMCLPMNALPSHRSVWRHVVSLALEDRSLLTLHDAKQAAANIMQIGYQVAQALAYLHAQEWVHGRLTTETVWVERNRVYVTDYAGPPGDHAWRAFDALLPTIDSDMWDFGWLIHQLWFGLDSPCTTDDHRTDFQTKLTCDASRFLIPHAWHIDKNTGRDARRSNVLFPESTRGAVASCMNMIPMSRMPPLGTKMYFLPGSIRDHND